MQFDINLLDLPRLFSTFDKDLLANIDRHYWKERLEINKLAKFKSDMSEVSDDIALQRRDILQTFERWGTQTCSQTIQTSVKSGDFPNAYPR